MSGETGSSYDETLAREIGNECATSRRARDAARATLAKLMKEESSDDDSDVELEIVGAPSPAKKARRESLSPSKSTTVEALKRARPKRAGGRRAFFSSKGCISYGPPGPPGISDTRACESTTPW